MKYIIIIAIIAISWYIIRKRKYKNNQQWKKDEEIQQQSIQYYEKLKRNSENEISDNIPFESISNYQQETEKQNYQLFFPYQKKYLLTKNEYYFYKKLIPIIQKYNLQILTKIRLADLVETKKDLNYVDRNAYFNKIKSKHIDFALVDNMKVVILIELDDSSHNNQSRIERDMFVDDVLQRCGYIIIHTYGSTDIIDHEARCYIERRN